MDLLDQQGNESETSPEEILASLRNADSSGADTTEKPAEKPGEGKAAGAAAHGEGQAEPEYEYVTEGGKKVKEPLSMILKRAPFGYNYAQYKHHLDQEKQQWETKLSESEKRHAEQEERLKQLARWQEFNDYAEKNPDWWNHVQDSWSKRDPSQVSQQKEDPRIAALESQLKELSEFKQQFVSKQTELEHSQQDKDFREEIVTAEKQFKVDMSQSDEQGRSLTWRVLEHMKNLGLDGSKKGHFTAAFKDYYFDNLMGRTAEQTKESVAKTQEQMKKAGIVSVSKQPPSRSNGFSPDKHSWDDLSKLALSDKSIFPGARN